MSTQKHDFTGRITAVKARIRLLRSFDQISHYYLGYVLVLDGKLRYVTTDGIRVAVGPKAHEKHQFRVGDHLGGSAVPVADPKTEWASHYKVSELRFYSRGPAEQDAPANPEGGIAPPLSEYRERGHRRLDKTTFEKHCQCCPFGLAMPTQMVIDQWNPTVAKEADAQSSECQSLPLSAGTEAPTGEPQIGGGPHNHPTSIGCIRQTVQRASRGFVSCS